MLFVVTDYVVRIGNSYNGGTMNVFIDLEDEPSFEEWDEFERRVTETVKERHKVESATVVILNYKKMRKGVV